MLQSSFIDFPLVHFPAKILSGILKKNKNIPLQISTKISQEKILPQTQLFLEKQSPRREVRNYWGVGQCPQKMLVSWTHLNPFFFHFYRQWGVNGQWGQGYLEHLCSGSNSEGISVGYAIAVGHTPKQIHDILKHISKIILILSYHFPIHHQPDLNIFSTTWRSGGNVTNIIARILFSRELIDPGKKKKKKVPGKKKKKKHVGVSRKCWNVNLKRAIFFLHQKLGKKLLSSRISQHYK